MPKRGPQPVSINWDEFDKLVSYQCSQIEVADFFGVSVDTLDRASQRDRGVKLADVWDKKKNLGRIKIKKVQFEIAEKGSAIMAIYLGKYLLGQTDTPIDEQILSAVQNSGLTREQVLELIAVSAAQGRTLHGIRSFSAFCSEAGYPAPFPKQIEMMQFGIDETEPRLLLGSRGYGKTDYVVILGIAFDIYLNPLTSTNLIMSKSKERNAAMINEIRCALEKNGVVLEKANATSLRVAGLLGKDHSVSAVTIKTVSLRGRHPKRVVLDDPVTEDDTSEATRLVVEKKWNEVNKLVSNVLIIGQPAHKFDLYAKLRPLLKKLEVPHGTIPELDHDLEAQRLAGVDESSIQASYFLKILNEGSTPFDKIKILDGSFGSADSIAFIDPSHEGGDYTALTILRSHFGGVAVVGFVWKRAWNHCLDEIVERMKKFGVKKVAFETNALGDQPVIMLRQLFGGGVVGRRSNTNKHSRIMAAGAYAHMIHISKESDAKYKDQVIQYEYKAKNDDAPDSLASCLEWVGLIRGKL